MNACDRMVPLLSALIDGELSGDESYETRLHLQSCDSCRREWESLQELDGHLKPLLVVRDVESKLNAITRACELRTTREAPHWNLARWVPFVVAVAVILLLALLPGLLSEKDIPATSTPAMETVARLVRSTGPIQVLSPGTNDWTDVSANSNTSLVAGSRLKTRYDVVCEFETSAKGTIRLNKSAELILRDPKQVELVSGQLWCLAPEDCGINVDVAIQSFDAPQIAVFACPSASEMQCEAGNASASYDSVSSANAEANVTIGAFSCNVAPGEMLSIDSNNRVDRTTKADSSTKVWQLPLLAMKGQADRELISLLNHVLAPIGMTKAMHLNERQIRQLGPPGAIPLLAYAATEASPEHLMLRQTAVRLAAELADEHATTLLETLQSDSDRYIADLAKQTLDRIHTSRD